MKFLRLASLLAFVGTALQAECPRVTEFDNLTQAHQQELIDNASASPFNEGVFWRAEKGGLTSYVVGTYHLPDPRIDPFLDQIAELVPEIDRLLVEANANTQAEFQKRLTSDPTLTFITEGPTLIDLLPPEEWQQIAGAATARGLPSFVAAKYQPWFLSMTLAIPPCAIEQATSGTPAIDKRVETLFANAGYSVDSLDTVDGLIRLFTADPIEKQVDDLRRGLALGMLSSENDMTTGELYFRETTQLIWEYTLDKARRAAGDDVAEVEALIAEMEQALLTDRNTAWASAILEHVESTPTMVAVGALHLPGETGVLRTLERAGFELTRLNVAFP